MPTTSQPTDFLGAIRRSGLLTDAEVAGAFDGEPPSDAMQCAAALVKAGKLTQFQASQLLVGKTRGFVLGPYKLLRPLGQGGMGVVYLAEHSGLGRKVAIKVLPPEKAKDQINLERFQREARSAAALDHPNIVRLHDISQGGGVHFLVFEYVEGKDLQSLMGETGALHFVQAAHYVAHAAAGLQHAHERGFVHRDIKPANLMLTRDGTVKILDMGLARSFDNPDDNLTANLGEGEIVGTVDYVSPEQCRGDRVDERSDIYSLGATLFALIAGHPPFTGSTAQKMMQHQLAEPQKLTKLRGRVPGPLCDVIAKMMAKAPKDRYQSAEEVADALAPWLPAPTTGRVAPDQGTEAAFRVGSGSRSKARTASVPVWKRKPVVIGAVAAVLVAGAALAVALSGGSPKKPSTDPYVANNSPQNGPNPIPRPNPNWTPDPAPVAIEGFVPGPLLFRTDFATVPLCRETIDAPGSSVYRTELNGTALPRGMGINHWNGRASGVYSVADFGGGRAFSMRQTAAAQGVQAHFGGSGLFAPPADRPIGVRVVYANDGPDEGGLFVECRREPYEKFAPVALPATGGQWKTAETVFRRPSGEAPYDVVVRVGTGTSAVGAIAIRSVEVHELVPAPASRDVFRLAAADFKPFRATKAGFNVTSGSAPTFPAGVYFACYSSTSSGEFACEPTDGHHALVWANLSGKPAAQIAVDLEPASGTGTGAATVPLGAGRKYRVAITYKTAGDARGAVYLQTQQTYQSWDGSWLDLPPTNEWRTVSFTTAKPDKPVRLLVDNLSTGADKLLFVRELTVREADAGAAPALPPTGKVLYALDLSGQQPFRDRGRTDGSGEWKWRSEQKTGPGALPAGWGGFAWRLEDEVEYSAEDVDGKPALGFRTLQGMGSAMLFAPSIDYPSGKARLTVEYRTPSSSVSLFTKFQRTKPTPERARDLKTLPATNGAWRTETVEVELNGATGGFFELHNNHGNGQPIHIRALVVTDGAEPVSAKPAPAPVVPVRANFGTFKPGAFPLSSAGAVGADGVAALEAAGWWANALEDGGTGELTAGTEDGAPVVTLVNKDGKPSLQLYQAKAGPALAGGKQYLLRFEYRAAEGTTGLLDVREQSVANWKDCPYSFKLDSTGGKWEARTFEIDATRDYPTVFVIQNRTGGAGNSLSVRKLELVPVTGN